MEKEELKECYPEFLPYEPYCRFGGCVHLSEPVCGVKEALAEGDFDFCPVCGKPLTDEAVDNMVMENGRR
mgnify:CR=1 FL=1